MSHSPKVLLLALILTLIAAVATAQTPDWSGWYAGAFGGYMNGKLTSNDEAHFETTGEFEDNVPIAGLQVGWNRQAESGWVFGGELILPLYMKDGEAVDTEFYPDADPPVTYVADYQWSVMLGFRAGKPLGNWLLYGFGALGMAASDGKTVNLDDDNMYSPGSEQVASATHMVWQLGAGGDVLVGERWVLGLRLLAFCSDQQQYEMPWNEGENNDFGMKSMLLQGQVGWRF